MAKASTKRVGGNTGSTATAESGNAGSAESGKEGKAPKVERVKFTGGVRNDDKKLTAIPEDWNPKVHKPLKSSDFADAADYLEWKASSMEARIKRQMEIIESCRTKAKTLRKFGDAKTRQKALKMDKMRREMQALQAELAEEGVNLEDLEALK